HSFQGLPVGGIVVDDEDADLGQIGEVGGGHRHRGGLDHEHGNGEKEGGARAGVLFSQISPPISLTNRREMARPRPVPPNRLVVELSTWEKASKSFFCFSSGMPMPVS